MSKKYNYTVKRMLGDLKRANWDQRLEVLRLSIQGWKGYQIAEKMGLSPQRVTAIKMKMGELTVEEAEKLSSL